MKKRYGLERVIKQFIDTGYQLVKETDEKVHYLHSQYHEDFIYYKDKKLEEYMKQKKQFELIDVYKWKQKTMEDIQHYYVYELNYRYLEKDYHIELIINSERYYFKQIFFIVGNTVCAFPDMITELTKEEVSVLKDAIYHLETYMMNDSEIRLRNLFNPIEKNDRFEKMMEKYLFNEG